MRLAPAYAWGRGEQLRYIDMTLPYHLLLVNPGVHVATKWAYGSIVPAVPQRRIESLLVNDTLQFDAAKEYFTNDFEGPVFREFPEVAAVRQQLLQSGAVFVRMSGSGSTMFGLYEDLHTARQAESLFAEQYFTWLDEKEEE